MTLMRPLIGLVNAAVPGDSVSQAAKAIGNVILPSQRTNRFRSNIISKRSEMKHPVDKSGSNKSSLEKLSGPTPYTNLRLHLSDPITRNYLSLFCYKCVLNILPSNTLSICNGATVLRALHI